MQLLILTAYLYKSFQSTKNPENVNEEVTKRLLRLSPTFLVYSSLQLIRLLDRLIYERVWVTSKEIQQEGEYTKQTTNSKKTYSCTVCRFWLWYGRKLLDLPFHFLFYSEIYRGTACGTGVLETGTDLRCLFGWTRYCKD